ncbi:glutathione S-transferase [Chytridium lagenaria]|nr:glutathione S-transferase [Chytridium lagenaria]
MPDSPTITLYTVGTPNGWKASIALEELGINYAVKKIDFSSLEQKQEWFLKINPNGRIPAMVDHARGDFNVFESGAMLLYLAEHYDPDHKILSADPNKKSEAIQWLMWQMGGLGPMQGQLNHFNRYAPEKIPYAIKRYYDETVRLFKTLERVLSDGREFIAGEYSIADIAIFGWVAAYDWAGVNMDETPLLEKWLFRVSERPAVRKGINVPTPSTVIEDGFKSKLSEEEKAKRAAEATKWILKQHEEEKK